MHRRILTFLLLLFVIVLNSVRPATGQAPVARITVGILLFDGVQIIDFTGPFEVFSQAGMEVWTASVEGVPITTHGGLRVQPTYALKEAPGADILVIPGGNVPHVAPKADPRLSWIKERSAKGATILSVCNGVFYLTSAGLLDGERATTYALMLDHLRMVAPKVTVVADERVVDNGKIVTAGGLSAGIDGALHLVARFHGEARARYVANNMEYDWRPDREFNRAELADVHIQNVIDFNPPAVRRVDEIYEGDENQWVLRWRITWPKQAEEMRHQFTKLANGAGWQPVDGPDLINGNPSTWTFKDQGGRNWQAKVTIVSEHEGEVLLAIRVNREPILR
ncbi:MAG: DJ-1/PfpI family protein [Gemmatimonadota bacterium]|nr:DJ-1/PfpI family protein [Gemmatimonadota bacterium]